MCARLTLRLAVAALALIAVALPALLSADDGDDETPELRTVTLQPGDNFVGWIEESMSVDSLMRQIPQITEVRAWDALRQQPFSPAELTAGMGVRISVESDDPITWRRAVRPVKGLVILREGRNLVTWMGVDQTPLDRAVLGVGSSLETASVWSPVRQTHTRFEATALREAANLPRLSRGDSIWVTVSRTVNWLQPTGRMPVVKFPGGAEEDVRQRILTDLSDTIEFFRTSFGIEADFSAFTVYAPTDADALIKVYRREVPDHYAVQDDYARIRSRWVGAGAWFQDDRIVIKQEQWRDAIWLRTAEVSGIDYWAGQENLTHEYTHIIQTQLSTPDGNLKAYTGYKRARAPRWLSEGHADWVAQMHAVSEGHLSQEAAVTQALQSVADAPPLERSLGSLAYDLGKAANHMINEQAGENAVNEMFRLMNTIGSGPNGRWQLTLSWESALEEVVGRSEADFYSEFESWRRGFTEQEAREGRRIEGRLVRHSEGGRSSAIELGLGDIRVELNGPPELNRQTLSGFPPTTWTNESGRFEFDELPSGHYNVIVYFGECAMSESIRIEGEDITDIEFAVTPDTCVYYIRGRVIGGGDSIPKHGWSMSAFGGGGWVRTRTQSDGQFVVVVPKSGLYSVEVTIGGCTVSDLNLSSPSIEVAGADVEGVRLQLPTDMCTWRLHGTLLNIDGTPQAGVRVFGGGEAGSGGAYTSSDGTFAFPVPTSGVYELRALIDGCWIYRGSRGPTEDRSSASQVRVSNADVTGIEFRLPENPASICS